MLSFDCKNAWFYFIELFGQLFLSGFIVCDINHLKLFMQAPKLFSGMNFYFSGDFFPAYKDDLQNLVTAAGGSVVKTKEQLATLSCAGQGSSTTLVVYNVDPVQPYTMDKGNSVVLQRHRTAEELATEFGCQVLKHIWILESIAACTLHPFF